MSNKQTKEEKLQASLQKVNAEYEKVLNGFLQFKEAAYQNALLASNIKSYVTGKLLAVETNEPETQKVLLDIVKELNKIEPNKPEIAEEK